MKLVKPIPTSKIAFVLLLVCCGVTAACVDSHAPPATYLLPEGYVGWARVDYQVKDAPELSIENGRQVYRFPPSGHLQTSSKLEYSRGRDVAYFYYSGDNRRRLKEEEMIWVGVSNPLEENAKESYQYIFVGPKEMYEQHHDRLFRLNEHGVFVRNDQLPEVGPLGVN